MVTLKNIQDARKAIAPFIKRTPLVQSQFFSTSCGCDVFLKLENLQITSSFKPRGVVNKLLHLSADEKSKGIITASAGNHGHAVAFAAQKLNYSARVVVPRTTPKIKIEGIRKYGADLVLFGETYDEAELKARELARKDGCAYVSPYNDELIIAGHGTIGLEIIEALPSVDTILVPLGGGGLISGISIAIKSNRPDVQVIGVQSKLSPVMYESLKAGKLVDIQMTEAKSIAEGLSGNVGRITFEVVQKYVERVMLVKEETLRHAIYLLWNYDKQVVEGSGAAAVAPLIENKILFKDKIIVSVVTGGNIDSDLFQSIMTSER
ncbi:MAG: pyridoxal-phosphate dependent enzyme [Candidatus Bathyarchaeota archaeon]|nr:MAG: pyridoxal-phosphate dependent enzyme [Candidatus Bathyarchaeota archaeon]